MDKYEFKKIKIKIQPLIIHEYIIYGLMHNNVMLDQQKLIGQIIDLYILHLNYLILFINSSYHRLNIQFYSKTQHIKKLNIFQNFKFYLKKIKFT